MTDATVNPKTSLFFSTQDILSRGWTKTMIKKWLPKPDKEVKVRGYRNLAFLYLQEKVVNIETTDSSFLEAKIKGAKCKEVGIQASKRKKEQNLAYIATLPIKISDLPKNYKRLALDSCIEAIPYWRFEKGNCDIPSVATDRIVVNYIRHQLTEYEEILVEKINGIVGTQEAYIILKTRILNLIAEKYPQFKVECDLQISRMIEEDKQLSFYLEMSKNHHV